MKKEIPDNIQKVIEEKVRPVLAKHYGDIEVLHYENGVLTFKLLGQCGGCPSARFTVEDVIEKQLREAIPEIKEFVLDTGFSDEMMDLARDVLNGNLKL